MHVENNGARFSIMPYNCNADNVTRFALFHSWVINAPGDMVMCTTARVVFKWSAYHQILVSDLVILLSEMVLCTNYDIRAC